MCENFQVIVLNLLTCPSETNIHIVLGITLIEEIQNPQNGHQAILLLCQGQQFKFLSGFLIGLCNFLQSYHNFGFLGQRGDMQNISDKSNIVCNLKANISLFYYTYIGPKIGSSQIDLLHCFCLLFRYSPLFSLVITVNLSSLLLLIYIFTLMCVESEQPSYIFYYICDLFYQYLSEFFACLLHTLHNQYTANIYNVTNPVFCCVPFLFTSPALQSFNCCPKCSAKQCTLFSTYRN